jgi:hypothetical protein
MPDFAPWLAKRSKTDPPTKALQDFASANAEKWPASSNSMAKIIDQDDFSVATA